MLRLGLQQHCTWRPLSRVSVRGQLKCETVRNRISYTSLLCNQDTDKLAPFIPSVTNKQHAVCDIWEFNLSCETWENVFIEEDVNTVFNNFLNTRKYLRIFNSSF